MTVIEWFHHPRIQELDEFVELHFDKQCIDSYYSQFNGIHFADFKNEITRWIEDMAGLWETLQELVDALPDDEQEEYEIEDE